MNFVACSRPAAGTLRKAYTGRKFCQKSLLQKLLKNTRDMDSGFLSFVSFFEDSTRCYVFIQHLLHFVPWHFISPLSPRLAELMIYKITEEGSQNKKNEKHSHIYSENSMIRKSSLRGGRGDSHTPLSWISCYLLYALYPPDIMIDRRTSFSCGIYRQQSPG
jgi:hypothetical protein